ncbi:MAG: Bcr/CflA family drug resistance efflux transporter, partial [Gammaproteobacteria bacterium]
MISPKSFVATAIIAALVAIGPLSTDMYLPAFPALMKAFDTEINQVQYTLSVFLVGFALAQLVYGPLSDRFGRKPVLLAGMVLFLISSVAIIFVSSIESLIVLRFFQAVGGSAGPVLGRAMVRDIYGPKDSAKQLAYIGTAMSLAPAAAPIMGGYLTVWWGWESTFVFLSIYGILAIVLLSSSFDETAPPGSHHVLTVSNLLNNYLILLKHPTWPWYTLTCTFIFSGLFSFLSGSSFVIIEFLGYREEQFGLFFALIVFGFMSGAMSGARLLNKYEIDTLIGWGAALGCVSG